MHIWNQVQSTHTNNHHYFHHIHFTIGPLLARAVSVSSHHTSPTIETIPGHSAPSAAPLPHVEVPVLVPIKVTINQIPFFAISELAVVTVTRDPEKLCPD